MSFVVAEVAGWREYFFFLSNLGIIAGYLFAALTTLSAPRLIPVLKPHLSDFARYHGVLFFTMCASTHFELAIHTAMDVPLLNLSEGEGPIDWHLIAIHVVQAYSIIGFLFFLGRDIVRFLVNAPTRKVIEVLEETEISSKESGDAGV